MFRIFSVVFMLFFVFGCANTTNSNYNSQNRDQMITGKYPRNIVQSVKSRVNQNGLLEFEVILQSSNQVTLDYKVSWVDANGFIMRTALDENYRRIILNPNQNFIIRKVAQEPCVKDFKLHFNVIKIYNENTKQY